MMNSHTETQGGAAEKAGRRLPYGEREGCPLPSEVVAGGETPWLGDGQQWAASPGGAAGLWLTF